MTLYRSFFKSLVLTLVFFVAVISCKEDILIIEDMPVPITQILRGVEVELDPSGYNPLAAYINLDMYSGQEVSDVLIRVIGKNGPASDVEASESITDTAVQLTILGLYGDYDNEVELTFLKANGFALSDTIITITTEALSAELPTITIDVPATTNWGGKMQLVSYWGGTGTLPGDFFAQMPFMMDKFGDIRWYLDYSSHPVLFGMNYVNGMEVLTNGNLFFGTAMSIPFGANNSPNDIFEIDRLGNVVNRWPIPGYQTHHEVLEKPDGNFIATVTKFSAPTVEDFLIEIDRTSGNIIKEWDLREALDYDRQTFTTDIVDWLHVNGIAYDDVDNSIIVSGRTQCVFKVDYNNKAQWILSPHQGWGNSGAGDNLNEVLLTPLDETGTTIIDTSILKGWARTENFDWTWGQHAPKILPNGNLLLFDNGDNRTFSGNAPEVAFSRAVEYTIDEANLTVQQKWNFGESYGFDAFSRIVSDADWMEEFNSVVITFGSVIQDGDYGKIVEVNRSTDQVLFEATIKAPAAFFSLLTMHRSERVSIY
ncbi:MAG: aryl-sulfate sulfotransferase [Bacteroidetes bacterium]|nr:aryl-sulfate sulfotransferase [Bacteroidota bacterium]